MNPFELHVTDLLRSRAAERKVDIAANVDWALELSQVEPAADGADNLTAQLTLSPIGGGLLVHGTARFVARHSCHRCLREWTEEMVVPISAMFVAEATDDETFPLADLIDVEPAVRDDVMLALPISPTCPDDGCDPQLVGTGQNGLNTTAPAGGTSADGTPEDLTDEGSPFAVLRDFLETGD